MKVLSRRPAISAFCLLALLLSQTTWTKAQRPASTEAREKYAEAVALFNEANSLPQTATEAEKRAAVEKFMSAAGIFQAIGSRSEQANSLNAGAALLDEVNERRRAVDLYIQVAGILTETGDTANLALTLNNIGGIFADVGLPQKALEYFERALPLKKKLRDLKGEALTLSLIGKAHDGLGDRQKAIPFFEKAFAIREKIGDQPGQAISLGDLGLAYHSLGENEKALGYLNRSMSVAIAAGDKQGEASALHNIANVYDSLGDKRTALNYYQRSLVAARAARYTKSEAATLHNLGTLYFELGDKERALEFLKKALEIRMRMADIHGLVATFINLSFHLEPDAAVGILNDSLVIVRGLGYRAAESDILHNLGYSYGRLGDPLKAIQYYNQALPLRRFVGDKAGEATTLGNLMDDWVALGNPRLAVLYGKRAVNNFQELRSAIKTLDPSIRRTYLSTIEDTYRKLADLLIEQGRIGEAEEVVAMLKEEEVFTFQRRDDKVSRELLQKVTLSQSERAAIAEYEKIAGQIMAIAREYGDLERERLEYPEGKFPKQARLDELERQRSGAIVTFQKYLEQIKIEFAKTAKDKEVALADSSLQETLRELKADRTAVVSTIVGEKRLNIIVTTADVQRAHTVDITAAELNKLVAGFRQALTSPAAGKPIDPRPAGQKLYDILVKPIEGDLAGIKADTIVWSLDGTLRYLPMAALWDKQRGYLTERFANAVITLASRDRLLLPPAKGNWTALGAGVSAPTDGFSALTAVPDELDCIVTDPVTKAVSAKPVCEIGVMPGRKLLDEKFDERSFRAAIGRYSILHLASHFKLVPGNDNDSFLLLGGGEDRRFTLSKLNSLSMTGVELLALSACNTATPGGEKANGVEVEGFGAVAQKKGAKAVLATLWPVADPSTRDFMVEFYKRFGTGSEAKAESIRQAQLKLMRGSYPDQSTPKPPRADALTVGVTADGPLFETDKNAPYAHPYYWAPFILFGNWR